MSYTLKLTNGKILLTLPDQQSDSVSTSLTLIGKNVNAYGTDLNDNFIKLLENFANTSEPTSPLIGQMWFNTIEQRMYVYNASDAFKPVGSPIVSATEPAGLSKGDLWIDTTAEQLKFYDGVNIIAAGPAYDASKGKSGWVVETVTDDANADHTVVGLYTNGTLQGILSDVAFTLRSDFQTSKGMSTVSIGFTAKAPMQFVGTATNALALGDVSKDYIFQTNKDQTTTGNFWINSDANPSFAIGADEDLQFYITNTNTNRVVNMALGGNNGTFDFTDKTGRHVLYYDGSTQCLGINTDTPAVSVDIVGDVRIQGNLEIFGTSTYITSADLRVENKIIELNYSTGPTTDFMADGGGLVLYGTTDKTFKWTNTTNAWTANTNIDLTTGTYKVGGVDVLGASSLGVAITAAPGLNTVGVLNSLTVGVIHMSGYSIGTSGAPLLIGLAPTPSIDFQGLKLHNLGTASYSDPGDIAANKAYVDSAVGVARAGQFATSIDVTGHATNPEDPNLNTFVLGILGFLIPPGDPPPYGVPENGRVRVLVTRYRSGAITAISDNIGFNSESVYRAGTSTPVNVVQYQSTYVATTTVPSTNLTVNRAVKQYIVSGGGWVPLPYSGSSNTVWSDGTW
jgi:hypothetical protein